ncbi:MAG: hypothetical protein HYZ00_00870, partial [Candidatus Hydrogenedentes bacterium]|nr:hypothetical protein [Candidatus Hydrogenedentota bacterium]
QRRWNAVLDHLELSLDEAKARHQACQAEVLRAEQALRELPPSPALEAAPQPPAQRRSEDAAFTKAPPALGEVEQELLNAPFAELHKFSLEQIALVQSHLEQAPQVQSDVTEHLIGRLELANQVREDTAVPAHAAEPQNFRRQLVLRAAIDKIQANRIDAMTPDEIQLVVACHSLLTRRLRPTPKDERLLRILGAALKVLQRKQGRG